MRVSGYSLIHSLCSRHGGGLGRRLLLYQTLFMKEPSTLCASFREGHVIADVWEEPAWGAPYAQTNSLHRIHLGSTRADELYIFYSEDIRDVLKAISKAADCIVELERESLVEALFPGRV